LSVTFSVLAREEIDSASRWYESQQEGLGQAFYSRVEQAALKIERSPTAFRTVYKDLRHVQLEQFKDWALWFRARSSEQLVIACLSGKRHPSLALERNLEQ
jgi:hypothetical protein